MSKLEVWKDMGNKKMKSVPAEHYNKEYFFDKKLWLTEDKLNYLRDGKVTPLCLNILKDIRIEKGDKVLDLGCGRGEGLIYFLNKGATAVGIDYSTSSLDISKGAITKLHKNKKYLLSQANAKSLPFKDDTFKVVFFSEVIEHLYPKELDRCLKEIRRILAKNGKLVLHTCPNRWYYDYGYKIYRFLRMLNDGTVLKKDPRNKIDYKLHVNEQTYFSLNRTLKKNGFKGRLWLGTEFEIKSKTPFKKAITNIFYKSPLKLFFAGHIYGILKKA